jgi:MFS family permease
VREPSPSAATPKRPAPGDGSAELLVAPRPLLAVMRLGDFRMLWGAQALSQLADKFLMFALIVVVYDLTGRSSAQSVLFLAYTLPSILLSAPAGVYADRHDKRALMIATNIVRGGLVLLIPVLQVVPRLRHQAWPLLVVTLLFSAVGQFFAPAEAASIPFLVERAHIMTATSLFMTTVILTLVVGVPLATISLRVGGDLIPFYVATVLFFLAAWCVWRVRTPLRAEAASEAPRNLLGELREGLSVLRGDPGLRVALALLTLALTIIFAVFALGPAYLRQVLGRPPEDTYLVLVPATVGLVSTAAVLGHRAQRVGRASTMIRGMIVGGAALGATGLVPGALRGTAAAVTVLPTTVGLSAAMGGALGTLLIPAFTVLQERTTEDTRGRIFGGIFTVINAAVAVPLLVAGGLADAFGVDRVVAGLGVVLGVSGVLCATRLRPLLKPLEHVASGAQPDASR